MKNTMTYARALTLAIENLTEVIYDGANTMESKEVVERLTALRASLAKRSQRSDDSKAKASAKRKDANAKARAELCAQIVPILREVITTDMTAKEIFTAAQERLPKDFTVGKVQAVLLREMKDEVVKTEAKGKPNIYTLR